MQNKRALIVGVVLLLVAALGLVVLRVASRHQRMFGEDSDRRRPPQAPAGLVTDRRKVGRIIGDALNAYFRRHGEYPPYLYGIDKAEDPLIRDGLLKAYPLSWPQPEGACLVCASNPWLLDERGYYRWVCNAYTPGQPQVRLSSMAREDFRIASEVAHRRRFSILGGVEHAADGVRTRYYSGGPKNEACNCFGYQRGEWLARDKTEAWLWLYGSNVWPAANPDPEQPAAAGQPGYSLFMNFDSTPPRGLDLLNAHTRELVPDGIPDGVSLLLHFKAGKLVETVNAEDLAGQTPTASSARPADGPAKTPQFVPGSVQLDPAGSWTFGQQAVLRAQAQALPQQQLAVYIGTQAAPALWLNDLGWPPDKLAGDGEFSGTIEWSLLEVSGARLPLRLELTAAGMEAVVLDAPPLAINAPPVVLKCYKYYNTQSGSGPGLQQRLLVEAGLSPVLFPGRVFACAPAAGIELELRDDGSEIGGEGYDGKWGGYLDTSNDLLASALELYIEVRAASGTTRFKYDPLARPAAPVVVKRIWREPDGPLRIGTPTTFHAELTGELRDVYIMITTPVPSKPGVITPPAEIAQLTTDGKPGTMGDPPGSRLDGDWRWKEHPLPPGKYNLKALLVSHSQDYLQELELGQVELLPEQP